MITPKKGEYPRKKPAGSQTGDSLSNSFQFGKVAPQARELEAAVLGAVLQERDAFDLAASIVRMDTFYAPAHRMIWDACTRVHISGNPIDLLTVAEWLQKSGELELIGGPYFLAGLTDAVVSSAHLESHCRIIQEKFMQREIIRIGGQMVQDGYEDSTDVFDLLSETEKQLFDITTGNLQKSYQSAARVAMDTMAQTEQLIANPGTITGVPTGYPALDRFTGGWQKDNLIILAARPSVGKTALALNLAWNAASSPWKPTGVGIFSLEMGSGELMKRLFSSVSQVGLDSIIHGKMTDWQMRNLQLAHARIASVNIQMDDTGGIDLYSLRAKARRMVARDKVGMIIIDYLQLMSGDGYNREDTISAISRGLKALAKELHIPIIALSQLNRDVEKRHGGEPQLSDLRESGAIEQDADVVAFLTRPDYQKKADDMDPMFRDDAWIKFKKHRNGTIDDLAFKMVKEIQTWFDLDAYYRYRDEHHWNQTPPAADNPRAGIRPPTAPKAIDPSEPRRDQLGDEDMPF